MSGFVRRLDLPKAPKPSQEAPEILGVPMVWRRKCWELRMGRIYAAIYWSPISDAWCGVLRVWDTPILPRTPEGKTERYVAGRLSQRLAPVVSGARDIYVLGGAFG